MAIIILTGSVVAKRISQLTAGNPAIIDTSLYKIAIDNDADAEALSLTLDELIALIDIIYKPVNEPTIVSGTPNTLTFDCNNRQQAKFAPRLSVGTLSINVDFTLALSNTTDTEVISFILSLTGTRIITFPSGVIAADVPSAYTWSSLALTIPAGTDDIIEFSLNKYGSGWLLRVGGVNA